MSTAAAPRADAGGVAALGAASSRLSLWFVPPIPRERLRSKVYSNVSGVTACNCHENLSCIPTSPAASLESCRAPIAGGFVSYNSPYCHVYILIL